MNKNKVLIKRRFEATLPQYNLLARTQQSICDRLATMAVRAVNGRPIGQALEAGAGTGFLTGRLFAAFPQAFWRLNDLVEASQEYLEHHIRATRHEFLWGDAETIAFPQNLELIATASTVQWFDDLPVFVRKCASATVPGGWLALSTFGPGNFSEIAALTGQGLSYYTAAELRATIEEAGYTLLEIDEYRDELLFTSPLEVLHHIRNTGVNSIESRPWTKGRLADFEKRYRESFPGPGGQGVTLTYHPILIVAQKNGQK